MSSLLHWIVIYILVNIAEYVAFKLVFTSLFGPRESDKT